MHGYFEEVIAGRKRAELRLNDRDYKVGDVYDLKEWDAEKGEYTGRVQNILITHVLKDFAGLQEGWCMFSFKTFEEVFTGADFGDIRKAAESIKALKALIFGEWVDTDIIERALGISFSEGLKRFDFSRTAEWCSIAGKTEEERKKNGQIITTKFRLKDPKFANWEHTPYGTDKCSLCGYTKSGDFKYCPNCGARIQNAREGEK